jgi:hypothetical protein
MLRLLGLIQPLLLTSGAEAQEDITVDVLFGSRGSPSTALALFETTFRASIVSV